MRVFQAENNAMRAREVKRRAKEEKMGELAATLVREAAANDALAARLKQTQAKLEEFTRRGLVATTVASESNSITLENDITGFLQ